MIGIVQHPDEWAIVLEDDALPITGFATTFKTNERNTWSWWRHK
ncbi:glycosyltransferase [Mycobacterium phage Wee]|uniref:Glycosyltransferase n=1 Tax=Mycobacterium phage Wee TaxID=938131 RepID=E7EJX3_9CAUD|nr:glycosyltransferase [Mycobacterium phage Wee]ADU15976.1 glycosyltransferase [Mycobacterium phage Wee]